MDNFMIENGWQENVYFKSYTDIVCCIILYMTLLTVCSLTYNTLQVVVYPTNDCYLGIIRLRWGGGGWVHIQ